MSLGTVHDVGGVGRQQSRSRPRARTQTRTKKPSKVSQEIIRHNRQILEARFEEIEYAIRFLIHRRIEVDKELCAVHEQCKHPKRTHAHSTDIFECPDCGYSNRSVHI